MKKQGFLLAISMTCLMLFTSCSGTADSMPAPSQAPSTTAPAGTAGPTASMAPSATTGVGDMMGELAAGMSPELGQDAGEKSGVNSVADAKRISDRIEDEVEKLSELDEAEAVVAGNIALVGISYDAQYQGGLTDRLEQMVTERVEMIDKAITAVHVTDDKDAVMKIKQLNEKLDDSQISFEELQTQVLDIGSTITGGGSPQISQPQSSTGT